MICPKCKEIIPDDSVFCTECGCNIEEERKAVNNSIEVPNKASKTNSPGLIFMITVLLIACGVLGYYVNNQNAQIISLNSIIEKKDEKIEEQNKSIDQLNKTINNLKSSANNYNSIVSFLKNDNVGYGSAKYYANKQIMFLNKTDKRKTISVTAKFDGEYTVYFEQSNGNISAQWSKSWNNNTTQLYVTPVNVGTTEINFTNNKNSTSFKVLVVVYE